MQTYGFSGRLQSRAVLSSRPAVCACIPASAVFTSSEDFKESYKYRLNYLGVPLCVRFVGEGKWYDGIYLGPAINFSMGGTTTYKRVGTGMQGVDANDTYKIKNLKSPVVSFKMGFDQKFSEKLGFHFEIESTFNPFNRSSESSSVSMRNFKFGITYYIL